MPSAVVTATKAAITIACGAAGYAVSQACAPGSDGKGGFALGVFAGNVLQGVVSEYGKDVGDWLSGKAGTLSARSTGPAINHDLDDLAAHAIVNCIAIAADKSNGLEPTHSFADTLARTTADDIRDLLRNPDFADTDDAAMLMFIGQRDGGMHTTAQTSSYWERFVQALAAAHSINVPATPRGTNIVDPTAFVADWIHRELAAQANHVLRDTFGPKGRPYIAAQMLYANKTLALLTQEAERNQVRHEALLPAVQGLHGAMEKLAATLGTMLDGAVTTLLEEANEFRASARTLFTELDDIHWTLYEIVRGQREFVDLFVPGLRLKPLALLPGGEPGTLRGARQIDFILRDAEMRELLAFLNSGQRVAWQLWHGAAGMGKSRLAFELCRRVDRSWEGKPCVWTAGFLQLPPGTITQWPAWKHTRPMLIVVDYAQERAEEIKSFIEHASQEAQSNALPPVRFLLLEREKDRSLLNQVLPGGDAEGWLAEAAHKGTDSTPQPTRALTPFAKHDLIRIVEAVYAARQRASPPGKTLSNPPDAAVVAARFQSSELELRPLFAILAAEAAIEGGDPATLSHERLARDWLDHEFNAWRKHFPKGDAGEASYQAHVTLVALATLAQGLPCPDGYRALHGKLAACGAGDLLPPAHAFAANWDALQHFYSLGKGGEAQSVPALRPDYLGELFVLDHLSKTVTNAPAQRALLRAALTLNQAGIFQFLQHAAQSHPDHPALAMLLDRGLELCPVGGPAWACPWAVGWVEYTLGSLAYRLGKHELCWNYYDRATAFPTLGGLQILHIAVATHRLRSDMPAAKRLLARLETLERVSGKVLCDAAGLLANALDDKAAAKRLLARLETLESVNGQMLCGAAGNLANALNDQAAAKRLLARLETLEGLSGDALCQAAGHLASALNDQAAAKRLLARLETVEGVSGEALCQAARLLANALNDQGAAKRLLARLETLEGVSGEALCQAARLLVNALNDHSGAKRLLARLETLEGLSGDALCQAAGHLANALNDQAAAKRLLVRLETLERVTGHSLLVAAELLANALNDQAAAKRLLARLETLEHVSGHSLLVAAELLANALNDQAAAKRLLARLETLERVSGHKLVVAAELLANTLNDLAPAKRLLARLETLERVSGHELVVAAGVLANALNDKEAAERLLARLETISNVNRHQLNDAWCLCRFNNLDPDLAERIEAKARQT